MPESGRGSLSRYGFPWRGPHHSPESICIIRMTRLRKSRISWFDEDQYLLNPATVQYWAAREWKHASAHGNGGGLIKAGTA